MTMSHEFSPYTDPASGRHYPEPDWESMYAHLQRKQEAPREYPPADPQDVDEFISHVLEVHDKWRQFGPFEAGEGRPGDLDW